MRFRLGLVTGLATGYYLGARAGRQRYDQINRTIARVRRTDAYEEAVDRAKAAAGEAAEKAKEVLEEGVDKARSAVSRSETNGHEEMTIPGVIVPTDPPIGPEGYSSSR